MNATDVLNMVRVHRDHVASRAATQEALGDRYGDHDAWVKARDLSVQVRDLDVLVANIERAIATEEPDERARRHEREDRGVSTGLAWAHRLILDAVGNETDARRRDGLHHAAEIVLQATKVMAR